MVQLSEVGPDRTVAGWNHLQRLVQRLGDLPQRRDPVPPCLRRQLVAAAMIAIASAKEVSISLAFWLIGIDLTLPDMDGDAHKYMIVQFRNTST